MDLILPTPWGMPCGGCILRCVRVLALTHGAERRRNKNGPADKSEGPCVLGLVSRHSQSTQSGKLDRDCMMGSIIAHINSNPNSPDCRTRFMRPRLCASPLGRDVDAVQSKPAPQLSPKGVRGAGHCTKWNDAEQVQCANGLPPEGYTLAPKSMGERDACRFSSTGFLSPSNYRFTKEHVTKQLTIHRN